MEEADASKEAGNSFFKTGDYASAIGNYSKGIVACKKAMTSSSGEGVEGSCAEALGSLYCNRAACYIKVADYEACAKDCYSALEVSPGLVKAHYRLALAQSGLGDCSSAAKSLSKLLHLDPKNKEAGALMIKVKEQLIRSRGGVNSEVSSVLAALESGRPDAAELQRLLKALVALLYDDIHHSVEFARKDGVGILSRMFISSVSEVESEISEFSLRVLSCAAAHKQFAAFIDVKATSLISCDGKEGFSVVRDGLPHSLLSLVGVCRLLMRPHLTATSQRQAVLLVMTIMRSLPPYQISSKSAEGDDVLVDTVPEETIREMLSGFIQVMASPLAAADGALMFTLCADGIAAMLSEHVDYFTPATPVDTRMESLEDRKRRYSLLNYAKERARRNAAMLVDMGLLGLLARCLEGSTALGNVTRRTAVDCIGRVIKAIDSDEKMKTVLASYIPPLSKEQLTSVDTATLATICRRAEITAAICATRPELGVWLFEQPGGCDHTIFMAARGDAYCQEVAAELLCLLAATASGPALLAPVIPSGVLELLLRSPVVAVKVAAAGAMLKLSIVAKALTEDSPEISAILNTASTVLKAAAATSLPTATNSSAASPPSSSSLVSFSSIDDSFFKNAGKVDKASSSSSNSSSSSSNDMTSSVERAVEMVAALVGRSHVKDEIVHGSYRVAPLIDALLSVAGTGRGTTAVYGILHIVAALTVTNGELRQKALAEKGITSEQYEKMQELQRIKAEDDKGDFVGEMPEKCTVDSDSNEKCMLRIKKLVAAGAISYCVSLLSDAAVSLTGAAKEVCCRALRQMCVCEVVRGAMVQQGGLRACSSVAVDANAVMTTRLEAAHAIAKTLVTTNPHVLSEHLRVGTVAPLLLLCRENDASNLQQFEALLSLTNIVSCGEVETEKLVTEKGVRSVHYLMFSEHPMVQRAATEALCNISYHEDVLAIMRRTDQVRLWLGMCEAYEVENESELVGDINNYKSVAEDTGAGASEEKESLKTARAAAGALAGALSDAAVCAAVMKEDFSTALLRLFLSRNVDLVHRALAMVLEFVGSGVPGALDYILDNKIDIVLKEVVGGIASSNSNLKGLYFQVLERLK